MIKIGIISRYGSLKDNRSILYLTDKLRRVLTNNNILVIPIIPYQDKDYTNTRFNEFNEIGDEEKKYLDSYLNLVDGIIIPGGNKITPFDYYILNEAIKRDIPTLGICLGMQLMAYFDKYFKPIKNESYINHFQESDDELTHKVYIKEDSLLYKIINKKEILVNSFHNYHIEENEKFNISAISEDGMIEGVEYPNKKFILGVQWHPEISYMFDEDSRKIIDYFINICKK